jgi:hypothetical protein
MAHSDRLRCPSDPQLKSRKVDRLAHLSQNLLMRLAHMLGHVSATPTPMFASVSPLRSVPTIRKAIADGKDLPRSPHKPRSTFHPLRSTAGVDKPVFALTGDLRPSFYRSAGSEIG